MLSARSLRALVPLVAAAVVLVGCSGGEESGFGGKGKVRQASSGDRVRLIEPVDREPAPTVAGSTLAGDKLDVESYGGKVVVLNFWGSWCGPCRDEVPVLQKVRKQTRDKGVRLVGVNVLDGKASARAFVRNQQIEYPSIYDPSNKVVLQFRGLIPPKAIPSTLLIDRQGRVAARIIGEAQYDQLMPLVQQVAGGGS